MSSIASWALLIVIANSLAFAELTIDNPKHLDVPEDKARVLLRLACRAVVKELHSREQSKADLDLRLVLGEKEEHYEIDEHGVSTLYLRQWNETKFATAALRLAVQNSIDRNREKRMILDILQRSGQIAAILANQLRGSNISPSSQAGMGEEHSCLDGIRNAGQRDISCGPSNQVPRR
jgi:hypothetical protein